MPEFFFTQSLQELSFLIEEERRPHLISDLIQFFCDKNTNRSLDVLSKICYYLWWCSQRESLWRQSLAIPRSQLIMTQMSFANEIVGTHQRTSADQLSSSCTASQKTLDMDPMLI